MAEKFNVIPEVLEGLSGKLVALADSNSTAESYIDTWLDVKGDVGGVFPNIASTIQQLRAELAANYVTLGDRTRSTATELATAAQMYRTLDRARAEELDRTYSPTYPEGE